MLISINGNIIDTTKIYRISPIQNNTKSWLYLGFKIYFFDNKELEINTHTHCYYDDGYGFVETNGEKTGIYSAKDYYKNHPILVSDKECTFETISNTKEYKNIKLKVEAAYSFAINHWNKDKSDIPSFNI